MRHLRAVHAVGIGDERLAEEGPPNARHELELEEVAREHARHVGVVEPDPAVRLADQPERQLAARALGPVAAADQSLVVAGRVQPRARPGSAPETGPRRSPSELLSSPGARVRSAPRARSATLLSMLIRADATDVDWVVAIAIWLLVSHIPSRPRCNRSSQADRLGLDQSDQSTAIVVKVAAVLRPRTASRQIARIRARPCVRRADPAPCLRLAAPPRVELDVDQDQHAQDAPEQGVGNREAPVPRSQNDW